MMPVSLASKGPLSPLLQVQAKSWGEKWFLERMPRSMAEAIFPASVKAILGMGEVKGNGEDKGIFLLIRLSIDVE